LFAPRSNADNGSYLTASASGAHAYFWPGVTATAAHADPWPGVSAAASHANPRARLAASGAHAYFWPGVTATGAHADPWPGVTATGAHADSRPGVTAAPSTWRSLATAGPNSRAGNSRAALASYWRQSLTRSRLASPQTA